MKNNIFKFITHQKQVTRQELLVEKLLTLNLKKEANADVSSSFKRQEIKFNSDKLSSVNPSSSS